MNYVKRKNRFVSLIISILVHAFLLLLFYFYSQKIGHFSNPIKKSENQDLAKVTFKNLIKQVEPANKKSIKESKINNLSNVSKELLIQDSQEDKKVKVLENKKLEDANENIDFQEKSFKAKTEKKVLKSDFRSLKKSKEKVKIRKLEKEDKVEKSGGLRSNVLKVEKKLPISPGGFLRAFRNSYRSEQFLDSSKEFKSNSSNIIQQRADQWKMANFIGKIKRAFRKAIRLMPGIYVNSNKSFEKVITIECLLLKDGTFKIVSLESSGLREIDQYLESFIKNIEHVPIPSHLNLESYKINRKILIDFNKDARFYTLRAYED